MKRNINLFLWTWVLLGLALSLGFQLYHTGLPLVREKAKMALVLAIDADLKRRVTESDLFYSYLPGKPEGEELWVTDDKGVRKVALDTTKLSLLLSFESRVRQSYLEESQPMCPDSIHALWNKHLRLVGVKVQTALSITTHFPDSVVRRHTSSVLVDVVATYCVGVENEIEIKAFWKGTFWTAILHGEWSSPVAMVHLSLIVFFLAFLVWQGVFSSNDSAPVNTVIKQVNDHCWQMGDVSFDSDLGTILEKGGAIHSARSQVNELLALFLVTSGHQLSVDEINEKIWISHGGIATTDSKNRLISDLRKFLKESQVPYQIKRISSRCYQLLPEEI